MTPLKPRIISKDGQLFAVLSIEEYQKLLSMAGVTHGLPAPLAERMGKGEHPIRIFREYRGMTQVELAAKAGIARPYLTEIETRKKQGSLPVLKTLAAALSVELSAIA